MLKNILKVGKALSKAQQQAVSGGRRDCRGGCPSGQCCSSNVCVPRNSPGHLCIGLSRP